MDGHEIDISDNPDIQDLNEKPIPILLSPGTASIHDSRLVHGSYSNHSDKRRLAFVVRFMDLKVKVGEWKYNNPLLKEWRQPYLISGTPRNDQYYYPKPKFKTLTEKQPPTAEETKVRQHFES